MRIKVFLMLIIFIFLLQAIFGQKDRQDKEDPGKFIQTKILTCSQNKSSAQCLHVAARDFVNHFTLEKILDVFEKSESQPEFFASCHSALHFVGQEYYKKINNVSKALLKCTAVCFEACSHGVLEGYLAEKNVALDSDLALKEEVLKICNKKEANKNPALFNQCLHGLGHALMFVSDGDLPRSLKLCDALENHRKRDWCYSGVFMENSTSSTNKDHPSKYLNTDDPLYPCNTLDEKYLDMCYTLQGLYFAKLADYDVEKTAEFCTRVPSDYQIGCFRAIGQERVGHTQDLNKIKQGCHLIKGKDYLEACLQGVLGALSARYAGNSKLLIEFCSILDQDNKRSCYNTMRNYLADWINSPKEFHSICLDIPESEYKAECLKAN